MADPQHNRPQPEEKRQGRPPHESTTWHPHNARKWTVLQTSTGGRTVRKSASLGSKYERGIVCEFHPDSFAALRREYSVLSIISHIPSPIGHPRIISADFKSGVLVLGSPKVRWTTLWQRVNEPVLDLDSLLQMKRELLDYVRSLYVKVLNIRSNRTISFLSENWLAAGYYIWVDGWRQISARYRIESNQPSGRHKRMNS